MKDKKQLIINIITIINIIIIIILSYKMIINSKFSQRFVKELIDNNNTNNYIVIKEEYSVKDETTSSEKIVQNENARKEEYLDTGKTIYYYNNFEINKDRKTYKKLESIQVDKNGNEENRVEISTKEIISSHPLKNEFNSYIFLDSSSEYKYLKKEIYKGEECIVVKFIINKEDSIKVWIDLEIGFILKEENYSTGVLESIVTYNIEKDVETDNILDIPNLNEYTFIE